MKKLLSLSALFLCSLAAWAQTYFSTDGIKYKIISEDEKTVEVAKKTYTGDIVIPEKVVRLNGTEYSVTSIGSSAFRNCSGLTSVTIPNSVTSIGNLAFDGCGGLTSINIPSSVNSIEDYTFRNCSGLTLINIPNSVTTIGYEAFRGCTNLTSLTIPNSVASIGNSAFDECSGLTSVTISNSVTNIGYRVFFGCSGLTSVTIPESVTSIGESAFYGCSGLTSVSIPNSVTSIGQGAFWNCSSLTSVTIPNSVTNIATQTFDSCSSLASVTIPNSVTTIEDGAFADCSALTSINIPNSVTSIGMSAFYGCSALTSINIPNSVTSIGMEAFYCCSALASINIPNSVTSIGDFAFKGCTELAVTFNCKEIVSDWYGAFDGIKEMIIGDGVESCNLTITCPKLTFRCKKIGKRYSSRDVNEIIFGEEVEEIETFALSSLAPLSVTYLSDKIFTSFSFNNLQSIVIGPKVRSINRNKLIKFDDITSIIVDSENTRYDSRNNCNAIIATASNTLVAGFKNTTIPNSVTSIGSSAFSSCSGLTSINIPNSVTSIGQMAFYDCSGLTSVTIPESVTSIGERAFWDCRGLTSLIIPNSVTDIGINAFCGCSGLTSITVESENPNYDSRDNCNAIIETSTNTLISGCMNTVIPNTVTSISYNAFFGCNGLTSVTIPNSVSSIGADAFYGCRSLTEIYSMISEPFEIATTCWQNVNKDIPLYVPAGCKAKYEATPGWNEFTNIVEIKEAAELEPVDESDNTDYGNGDIDDTTELNGNVVGNIYYNIADENGAYSSSEGCIILKKSTRDSSVEGTDIFGEEFKNNLTGIIFKVHAGSGTIKVNAEAIGNMILKVKVGNNAPLSIELQGKMKASFPYTVSEESYVYIYGGESSSAAKGTRAVDTESVLKIYGIEWSETYEPSGIESLNNGPDAKTVIYNLNGQRINNPSRGIYIVNGRKVLVK